MPRKLRRPKRRIGGEAERRAWGMLFMSGHDYLSDLDSFGLLADEEKRTAASAAWHQFGAEFMATWKPNRHRALPWAHEQFGEPPCR